MGEGGGRSGRVDEGAGAVDEEVDPLTRGGDVATGEAGGLAEGAHLEGDAVLETEGFGESHALGAEDAKGMGFVDPDEGVVGMARSRISRSGQVTVHAEDRFGDDEDAALGRLRAGGCEEFAELGEVVVRKDPQDRSGETSGVDEGRVAELVEDQGVAGACDGGEAARAVAKPEEKTRAASVPLAAARSSSRAEWGARVPATRREAANLSHNGGYPR